MATITIQFEGICCHIKHASLPVERRSLLPTVPQHIPYIEVYATDVDPNANPQFTFIPYTRFNSSYQRIELSNARIELPDIASTSFQLLPSFDQRIPKLQAVEPRFTGLKQELLQTPVPSNSGVAAYFDFQFGVLSSGPSEDFRTVFQPPKVWPVRHLGQWGQLEVEINGTIPTLRVFDRATGNSQDLVLEDGADLITIGNQMLEDILGIPGSTGHFMHYYDLADPRPDPPLPEPEISAGLGIGCSNTNFP
jgi:hypothetical protein